MVYGLINIVMKLLFMFKDRFYYPSIISYISGAGYSRSIYEKGGEESWSSIISPVATLMYVIRFAEWWRWRSMREKGASEEDAMIIPLAPVNAYPPDKCAPFKDSPGLCPLCSLKPNKPATIPSGRIFCEDCIRSHLQNYGKCPVTEITVQESQIRTLFLHQ